MPRLAARHAARRLRAGTTLAEILVAVCLATLISAGSATAMLNAERYVRQAGTSSENRRAARDVGFTLGAELRLAAFDSLRLRGDTAVEFLALIGSSVACAVGDGVLVLPPAVATRGVPLSVWRDAPEAGDIVAVFDTSGLGGWHAAIVRSTASPASGAECTPATGLLSPLDSTARRAVVQLFVDRPLPPGAGVGVPVRVVRRARYVLFHGGDGSWSLAYRRCDNAGGCGTAQAVAGPLAAAADSGLRFALVPGESGIDATVRAPRGAAGMPQASVAFRISLRNHETGDP